MAKGKEQGSLAERLKGTGRNKQASSLNFLHCAGKLHP